MPIDTDPGSPTYGQETEEGESGGSLRKKLEETLARSGSLEQELRSYKIKDKLAELGLDLVKPEDLTSVDLDKIEDKAKEIQAERKELQKNLLRDVLVKRGVDEGEVDEMVEAFAGGASRETRNAEALDRARALGALEAEPIPLVDESKLHGLDAIKGGIEKTARKSGGAL